MATIKIEIDETGINAVRNSFVNTNYQFPPISVMSACSMGLTDPKVPLINHIIFAFGPSSDALPEFEKLFYSIGWSANLGWQDYTPVSLDKTNVQSWTQGTKNLLGDLVTKQLLRIYDDSVPGYLTAAQVKAL